MDLNAWVRVEWRISLTKVEKITTVNTYFQKENSKLKAHSGGQK